MSSSTNAGAAAAQFSARTPEILWHSDNSGKPTPIFAVDICPRPPASPSSSSEGAISSSSAPSAAASGAYILATCGLDGSAPTKGSVRIWHVSSDKQEFRVEYSDHQTSINAIRFSPCGRMLATASDRLIIIYSVASSEVWSTISDSTTVQRNRINPHLQEIYDIKWSPDSQYVIAGSIDCKAELCRVSTKGDSIPLSGHTSFVQGVAWDPLNEVVVTQSADRSCRTYQVKSRSGFGSSVRVLPRGSTVIKMQDMGPNIPASSATEAASSASTTPGGAAATTAAAGNTPVAPKGQYLFADDTIASFFRRPDFAPDGSILVAPTGIYRVPAATTGPASGGGKSSGTATAAVDLTASAPAPTKSQQSFCCHVFARNQLTFPIVSLAGLEEPAISVRFSSVLYNWIDSNSARLVNGKFRFVFSVTTSSSILIYDTQHTNPIVRLTGRHFSNINDSAWSTDGRLLCCCSSDGYVTILRFEAGALGTAVDPSMVPDEVKMSHPCQYGYTGPAQTEASQTETAEPEAKDVAKAAEGEANITPPVVEVGSPRSEQPTDSGHASGADVTAVGSATASAEKKRKRINPTPLGNLDAASLLTKTSVANDAFVSSPIATPSTASSSSSSAASAAPAATVNTSSEPAAAAAPTPVSADGGPVAVTTTVTDDATAAKKAKKRIAPVLVVS